MDSGGRGTRSGPYLAALIGIVLLAACGSGDGESVAEQTTTTTTAQTTTSTTVDDRPAGPAAELTALPDGDVFVGSPEPFVPDDGYVQEEFTAEGTATSFVAVGELTGDGEWELETGESADYRTRLVVRRPELADDFSGTVVVEWFNVSGGLDADPEWTSIREEVLRQGHAWVGVSAQVLGVEGGPTLVAVGDVGVDVVGKGLKAIDPDRYGDLAHPGDAFANDIFTQAARAIRAGDALGDLAPTSVVAAGESQAAFGLVTYINGVQLDTQAFDGFFLHSRGAAGLPVVPPGGAAADIAGSFSGAPTIIRADLDVPVFNIQAENDVAGILGAYRARQPDSDVFRLWEIAGTAHADRHIMGESTAEGVDCGAPINDGPMHLVAKAAFRHFVDWVVAGTPPPEMPRLELTEGEQVAIVRDPDGIAIGGVRTPPVDVPVQALSGEAGPAPSTICLLSGSTNPIPAERLADLYSSGDDYQRQYDAAIDAAIESGVLLADDRAAIEALARPDLVGP